MRKEKGGEVMSLLKTRRGVHPFYVESGEGRKRERNRAGRSMPRASRTKRKRTAFTPFSTLVRAVRGGGKGEKREKGGGVGMGQRRRPGKEGKYFPIARPCRRGKEGEEEGGSMFLYLSTFTIQNGKKKGREDF